MIAQEITGSRKRWEADFYLVAHENMGFEGAFLSLESVLHRIGQLLRNEIDDVAHFDEERAARIEGFLNAGEILRAYEEFNRDPEGHAIGVLEFKLDADLRPGMNIFLAEYHPPDEVPRYVAWSTREERDAELLASKKRIGEGHEAWEHTTTIDAKLEA